MGRESREAILPCKQEVTGAIPVRSTMMQLAVQQMLHEAGFVVNGSNIDVYYPGFPRVWYCWVEFREGKVKFQDKYARGILPVLEFELADPELIEKITRTLLETP